MLINLIKKELLRVFTDRRLVISTFIIPAVSIYILYSLMGNMAGDMQEEFNEHQSTIYVNNAPEDFVAFYNSVEKQFNMSIRFGTFNKADFEEQIRNGDVDLLVDFDPNFTNMVSDYKSQSTLPEIKTFYNSIEDYSIGARDAFVFNLLEQYKSMLLAERFGNIQYAQAFTVDSTNQEAVIVDEKKAGSSILNGMLPMLIAILLFAGAMGIGMDTIAGEKERGTMATLLMTPVKRETIALGKVIGLGLLAIISAMASFIAIISSLPNMMSSMGENVSAGLSFDALQYVQLIIIMISLVGIYVGLICLISVRARSVKEAGTYVTPVYLVIFGIAMTSMFTRGADVALYKFAIPVYGSITAIKQLFQFELNLQEFALSTAVALILATVLIKMITKAFNDEKVMFNA